MRLFIAIEIPKAVKLQLIELKNWLCSFGIVSKWVEEDNIHLTLQFLGETNEKQVDKIIKAIRNACSGKSVLDLQLGEIGCFASNGEIKVIWAGISGNITELSRIQKNIAFTLSELGFVSNKPFNPHLTLGRGADIMSGDFARLKDEWAWPEEIIFRAEKISLIESKLTSAGSIYNVISEIQLKP